MQVRDFLKLVWPAQGFYCTAIPHINKNGKLGYKHALHDDIEEAYQDSRSRYHQHDMYFGIFTHVQKFVFSQQYNRLAPNRTHANMDEAKCLFLDLDVGKVTKEKPKYASQEDALSHLARFLFRTGMPVPIVVSSGNGIHVYWPFEDPLKAVDWRPHAQALRLLLDQHKVIYDSSRTTDMSSVLRVPATLNHKDPADLKKVQILSDGDEATSNQALFGLLADLTKGLQRMASPMSVVVNGLPTNIGPGANFPPTEPDDVAAECEQIRIFRDTKGNISEGHWYSGIGAIGYCTNGEATIHAWSAGHPNYTVEETDAKIAQWKSNASVTSCAKLNADGVQGVCQRCPHFGKQFKNPIVITNKKPIAPPPPPPIPPTPMAFVPAVPRAHHSAAKFFVPVKEPHGFTRTQGLGITHTDTSKQPPVVTTVIDQYDLYPVSLCDGFAESGVHLNGGLSTWISREHTKRGVFEKVFDINNAALVNKEKLGEALIGAGLFFPVTPKVQSFMSMYLKQLKAEHGMRQQYASLGWTMDTSVQPATIKKFVMNGFTIDRNGKTELAVMSPQADIAIAGMTQGGTYQGQIDALRFYGDPSYFPHQFAILSSLSAPLLAATDQPGVIISLSGDSGASKSSALYAAGGLWGNPKKTVLNGTDRGMSAMARELRASIIPNHPTLLDEVTHMDPFDMRTMAMTWTQHSLRQTLKSDRSLREKDLGGVRAAPLILSANGDLHQKLNAENAVAGVANSARLLQMMVSNTTMPHTKEEADAARSEFFKHHGFVGEAFMVAAMPTIDLLMDSVRRMMVKLDRRLVVAPSYRFYTAAAAPVFVAGAFAVYHGLLDWDMDALYEWFCDVQWPHLVADMAAQQGYVDPARVLRQFINDQTLNTIIDDGTGNIPPAAIRDQVVVHNRTDKKEMYISIPVFKTWCAHRGTAMTDLIEKLYVANVIRIKETRKVLGRGTRYAGVTNVVFVVNTDELNK